MKKASNKALLIVDPQNDFCPGGALGVTECDEMIRMINAYIMIFRKERLPILVSRDWHPKKTSHFKEYGGPWPVHCVQGTHGAEFHPELKLPLDVIIFSKGTDPAAQGYSVFESANYSGIPFSVILKMLEINELFIGGLATDYCVRASALDALKKGIRVGILVDAIRGVDVNPGDSRKALHEMSANGAEELSFDLFRENIPDLRQQAES
jgi:nicotinamidase/pyrazinamidase